MAAYTINYEVNLGKMHSDAIAEIDMMQKYALFNLLTIRLSSRMLTTGRRPKS